MAESVISIPASDIFFYVDTYRKMIRLNVGEINREKEKYEAQYWQQDYVGTRYYAGLRAFEHATDFVLRDESPGMVVFGDTEKHEEAVDEKEMLVEQARKKLREQYEGQINALEQQLKQAKGIVDDLQGEVVEKNQTINRLTRRIEQSQSTYIVLIGVMALVIAALLGITIF